LAGGIAGILWKGYSDRLTAPLQKLRVQCDKLFAILDAIEGATYVADMDTYEILYANRHALETYGDVVGKRCKESIREGVAGPCLSCRNDQLLNARGQPGPPVLREYENTRTARWYQCVSRAIRWPDRRLVRMEAAFDITERKKAEARSEHLAAVLRAVRNVNQLITKEKDRGRLLQRACDFLTETRGYHNAWITLWDETKGLLASVESGLGEAFRPMIARFKRRSLPHCGLKALGRRGVCVVDDPVTRCGDCPLAKSYEGRAGMCVRLEYGGTVYGLLSVSIPPHFAGDEEEHQLFNEVGDDIAFALHGIDSEEERERAETQARLQQEQLVQADKMVALGTLVSGIGHEINNPNNFVMLNVPVLKGAWESAVPVLDEYHREHPDFRVRGIPFADARRMIPELLEDILAGAGRIKRIVNELKDYARQQESTLDERVDTNEVVRSAIVLSNAFVRKSTQEFSVEYGEGLPSIRGSAQRIEQVVINLLQNACEALRNRQESVSIGTSYDEVRKGIVIAMSDQGVGISKENLRHVTDPFFTTRRASGGTGLGLSIAARIVEDHGGTLSFQSSPGEGTIATVFLPVATEDKQEGEQ